MSLICRTRAAARTSCRESCAVRPEASPRDRQFLFSFYSHTRPNYTGAQTAYALALARHPQACVNCSCDTPLVKAPFHSTSASAEACC